MVHRLQTKAKLGINFKLWSAAGTPPPWWREAGEGGTKKLYQPEPRPVVYVVPITSILGRLLLIPAGDHGIILAAMRHCKKEFFEYVKCDESARPGTGSKLYYINSWAMYWPSEHMAHELTLASHRIQTDRIHQLTRFPAMLTFRRPL
jgi:hypothetical protein